MSRGRVHLKVPYDEGGYIGGYGAYGHGGMGGFRRPWWAGADTASETLKALACANCRGRCARDLQVRTRLGVPEWWPAGMIVGVVVQCIKPTARPLRAPTVA